MNHRRTDLIFTVISGVPGTGKTATVLEVMAALRHKVARKVAASLITSHFLQEIDDFTFVEINAMKLTDPVVAFSRLWKELSGKKGILSHVIFSV